MAVMTQHIKPQPPVAACRNSVHWITMDIPASMSVQRDSAHLKPRYRWTFMKLHPQPTKHARTWKKDLHLKTVIQSVRDSSENIASDFGRPRYSDAEFVAKHLRTHRACTRRSAQCNCFRIDDSRLADGNGNYRNKKALKRLMVTTMY
jgi:nickel-dependent lactate racemase